MYHWDYFATIEPELPAIKAAIDRSAETEHTLCFDMQMPESCRPSQIKLHLGHSDNGYFMLADPPFQYSGDHACVQQFSAYQRLDFHTFQGMWKNLLSVADALRIPTGSTAVPSAPAEHAVGRIYTETEQIPPPRTTDRICISAEEFIDRCAEQVIGQDSALMNVASVLLPHLAKREPLRPLCLFFHGQTGIGKTELAKTLHKVINAFAPNAAKYGFICEDMSQYQDAHSAYKLIGAPPSYVGYGDQTIFNAVDSNPKQIFVFDEIEKAHPNVLKVLMRAMDEGKHARSTISNEHGNAFDLRQCIFIFTSNLELPQTQLNAAMLKELSDAQKNNLFLQEDECARTAMRVQGYLPEVVGRISRFVAFSALSDRSVQSIIQKAIAEEAAQFGLEIHHVSPQLIGELRDKYQTAAGARSLRLLVSSYLGMAFSDASQRETAAYHLEGTLDHLQMAAVTGLPDCP